MQKQILKDTFITVFDSLRAHKLRSALTILGVGVAFFPRFVLEIDVESRT